MDTIKRTSDNLAQDTAESLLNSFPEPTNTELGDTTENPTPGAPELSKGPVDVFGRGFDPALHSADESGAPKITKNGYLRLKRGAPKGEKRINTNSSIDSGGNAIPETPEMPVNLQNRAIGKMLSSTLVGVRVWFGGVECAPEKAEIEGLDGALVAWLDYENFSVSPRWGAAAALGMFMLPAVFTEKGQEKINRLVNKIKPQGE